MRHGPEGHKGEKTIGLRWYLAGHRAKLLPPVPLIGSAQNLLFARLRLQRSDGLGHSGRFVPSWHNDAYHVTLRCQEAGHE